MRLQAAQRSGSGCGITPDNAVASAVTGLNIYWRETQKPPFLEWKKWPELFTVAMVANHSISLPESTP